MSQPVSYRVVGNVGVITIDSPPVNAFSHAVREGLLTTMRDAVADATGIVLIACAGRTFVAGADISEFGKPPADPWLPEVLDFIENAPKPVVTAVHGTALGGGFELVLASHYRCALTSARVGLPEVHLGLLPGAGGTQRAPRLAGVDAALDLMLTGKPIVAGKAEALGLIDKVFDDDLEANALEWCEELLAAGLGPRKVSDAPVPPTDSAIFDGTRAQLKKRARGQLAPFKIVDCVEEATRTDYAVGAIFEQDRFRECLESPQSAAMRHLFFAEREAAKIKGLPKDTPIREIASVGVIGGGTMGGGIAMSCANAGIPVKLLEVDDAALERGFAVIDGNYAATVKKGRLKEDVAEARRALIEGTTDYAALADVDLVIEAVFEDPELKMSIFRKLDEVCKPGAILATNTSYQDVDAIAAVTSRPGDCLGLHFFSPANVMKLLEVVRGDKTADDVLATSIKFAKRIRKVPAVSRVCYGFIGNRMVNPYMREAQKLLLDGATPEAVDAALYGFGMAMGPVAVSDLAGLDIGYKARQALPPEERGDETAFRVVDALVEDGRLGQKSGAGFYNYDPATRKPSPEPAVMQLIVETSEALGIERREIGETEIVERCVFALVNEGLKILEEGIAQRPGDIDIVYLYGYGFPVFRGGPMFYADAVGLPHVLERVREFDERFGSGAPAALLETLVADGMSIADWAAQDA